MNVTLSLDDDLVKRVRKLAVDRDTTLTGLIRQHLQELVESDASSLRKRREMEALRKSFDEFEGKVGKRNWTRADLYERS